jgi:hypothetical protein
VRRFIAAFRMASNDGARMDDCMRLNSVQLVAFIFVASILADVRGQVNRDGPVGGTVESCNFPTQSLPPAFRPPKQFAEGYKLFKAGGALVPEDVTVKAVILAGNSRLGLTTEQTKRLSADMDRVYSRISADALFKNVPSALPYCLADTRPAQGHYFAYYPPKVADDTPVIVFLHGFGGNFLFYAHLLKEEFPDAVILLPSWGASWHDGTLQYLDDLYADVKRRKSLTVRRPCLMAISAGGPAGFRLYNQRPDGFSCCVAIASAPSQAIVPQLKSDLKILMVNGKQDSRFPLAAVQSITTQLAQRLPHFRLHVLDGDHFFLLAKREETFRVIKEFLDKK